MASTALETVNITLALDRFCKFEQMWIGVLVILARSTWEGSYSMAAFSAAKLTFAVSTPGVSLRPFSMVAAQVVQVIPLTRIFAFCAFLVSGVFAMVFLKIYLLLMLNNTSVLLHFHLDIKVINTFNIFQRANKGGKSVANDVIGKGG